MLLELELELRLKYVYVILFFFACVCQLGPDTVSLGQRYLTLMQVSMKENQTGHKSHVVSYS